MTQGRARRFCTGIAVACAVALAAACGSYRPNRIEFRFTPVPYTVVTDNCYPNTAWCSHVYSLDERCEWYPADQIVVLVTEAKRNAFRAWADSAGFDMIVSGTPSVFQGTPQPTDILLRVPAGSVPDAVNLIAKRPEVVSASPNITFWVPELIPDFIGECRRRLRQQTPSATP